MTKYYTIYKITHVPSGKFYVGRHVTTNLEDGYMGSGKYIRHAIKKHGIDNFIKEYLHIFYDEYFMFLHEEAIVTKEFCKREDTYNIAPGGFGGGWTYINTLERSDDWKRSQTRKLKYHVANNGRKNGRKNLQNAHRDGKIPYNNFKGKTHSEETKQKIGVANSKHQSGKGNSQYGTMWITNGVESKKIKKDQEIPEGYRRGRKILAHSSTG